MRAFSFAVIALSLSASLAKACPENLKGYRSEFLRGMDVCELHDRYQAALNGLREKNFYPPERLGNLMAPRFINLPDWTEKKDRNRDRAMRVYDPAPTTWQSWEAGVKIVDAQALKNFSQRSMTPLTLEWLKNVHASTLNGLLSTAGEFRQVEELGLALTHKFALTAKESSAVKTIEYKDSRGGDLISFRPTQCLEDRDLIFQDQFKQRRYFDTDLWPAIDADKFFVDAKGQKRQCGFYMYAPLSEVPDQLNKWVSYINDSIATWGGSHPQNDPILVTARAQRWFIVIHPYERGNGRSSRFVMDLLLKSVGLPAPILEDMNADLYSTEKEWAQQVGDGVIRAVRAAEFCRLRPGGKGCSIISQPLEAEGVVP